MGGALAGKRMSADIAGLAIRKLSADRSASFFIDESSYCCFFDFQLSQLGCGFAVPGKTQSAIFNLKRYLVVD
jgi:hypothetical protein